MTEKESALYSQYIIDGVKYDATPAELLEECMRMTGAIKPDKCSHADIVDESTEPPVTTFTYDNGRDSEYLQACLEASQEDRTFRMLYPDTFTRQRIAYALIDRLWNQGHYRLGNLEMSAKWSWNKRPLGNMAAFYTSAEAVNSYLFDLGVRLCECTFEECDQESAAWFEAWLPEREPEEDDDTQEVTFKSSPFESRHPWISEERKCPPTLKDDPSSWIIYIPFDTCSFRIGGSLLAQSQGRNGGVAPQIKDPDYFIDCYEVIRELVEDGIVMAGETVGDGGLATAAGKMCADCGLDMDLSGLMASYQENDSTKLLFGEVPGVLIQISDNDYDYLDSQLILQDVAYYPIGHPDPAKTGITFLKGEKNGVAGILASLLGQASEGED
jgi:phosphoribosylformylglycinamidine synthase